MRIITGKMGTDSEGWRCIPCLLIGMTFLLTFCTECLVSAIILPPIHWNASNPMFKTSNNDHVIQVNMFDELDFICPSFDEWDESSQFEYYIIYQVSRKEYEDCYIYPETKARMIVNCSSPNQRKRFTLLFYPFGAIPHVPEFKKGESYYYISTSTGHRDGIANVQQGACLYRNMKLSITVCCVDTTTSPPSVNVTTSNPPSPTSQILISEDVPNTTTTTTTTTTSRPTTRRTTTTHRVTTTTTSDNMHETERVTDRTSTKPFYHDKEIENSISKTVDVIQGPKQEGQVNSATSLTPLTSTLCLATLLSWLRR